MASPGKRGPRPDAAPDATPPASEPKRARKPPAHLPEPRGRRGHMKVDEIPGLSELVTEWVREKPRPTLEQMHERSLNFIKSSGLEDYIGKTAIFHWVTAFECAQAERDLALTIVEKYNATSAEGDALAIEEAIAMIANVEIFRDVYAQVGHGLDDKTLEKVKIFFKGQSSSAQRLRAQLMANRSDRRLLQWFAGIVQDALKHDSAAKVAILEQVQGKMVEGRT